MDVWSVLRIIRNCVVGENSKWFGIALPELRVKNYQNKRLAFVNT